MIQMDDFRKPDGQVDWAAMREAEIAAGERCYKCGAIIMLEQGVRTLCYNCKALLEDGEVRHGCFVRCPACKDSWGIVDSEDYECYEEGEHKVTCGECDHTFEVTTSVSYTFTSPEIIVEKQLDTD